MNAKTLIKANKAVTEQITPAIAQEYLLRNIDNRPVSPRTVELYAASMTKGEWKFNGDTICFSEDGDLFDGQHRLLAVIRSGTTQEWVVVRGLDKETFVTMDIGKRRGLSDALFIAGHTEHKNIVAGAITLLYVSKLSSDWDGQIKPKGLTNTVGLAVLEQHPDIIECAARVSKSDFKFCRSMLSPSSTAFCYYWLSLIDWDAAQTFFKDLDGGVGLEIGSPALALRGRLISDISLRITNNQTKRIRIGMLFKAWNAYRAGSAMSRMSWSEKTKFTTPK